MNEKITFTADEKMKLSSPLYDYSDEGACEKYIELKGEREVFYISEYRTKKMD